MTETPSNLIRTPAQVAQAMRYVAERVAMVRGLEPTLYATLLGTWAEILEGAPRAPLPEVAADRLDLATEIETTADAIAAECMVNGGRFELGHGDAPGFIAWLREIARQAAVLQVRAAGFHFDPALPPPPAPHPDDIVPGLETGAGDPVTFALLDRLREQRAQRVPTRPCDTDVRPLAELTAKRPTAASPPSTALPCDTEDPR
jgi:hypothetical protein